MALVSRWGRNVNFRLDGAKSPFPMPLCKGHKLEDASVDEIQDWYDQGTLRIVDVVQCYIERIRQVDSNVKFVIRILFFRDINVNSIPGVSWSSILTCSSLPPNSTKSSLLVRNEVGFDSIIQVEVHP